MIEVEEYDPFREHEKPTLAERLRQRWFEITLVIRRRWWNLRHIPHRWRNEDHLNATVAASPKDGSEGIQAAIDRMSGTDTPEYARYLEARTIYDAKWNRFFIRKPVQVNGGTVYLESGDFYFAGTLTIPSDVTVDASGRSPRVKGVR